MWLLALAPLATASTLHFESDARADVHVGEEQARLAPNGSADLKEVDGGTWRVEVRDGDAVPWAGDLVLPDGAEVWLAWRGGDLVLLEAAREASGAQKAAKAGNTLMAIGAGIQAANDVASAGSAAADDISRAQRGEAVESSNTQGQVSIGPNGVQSSTSRTTAGAGGVHHESTATSIGPDGVARSTNEADLGLGGVSVSDSSTRVSRIEVPGDGDPMVISLVEVGVGAPPSVGAAAPPPAEKPETLWYHEPIEFDLGGAHWTLLDPVAEAEVFKLAVKVEAEGADAVVWDPAGATARFDGVEVASRGGKVMTVGKGSKDRFTLVFEQRDGELRADDLVLSLGTAEVVALGDGLGLGAVGAVAGEVASGGGLACTVASAAMAKKDTKVVLDCANSGTDRVWLVPSGGALGFGDAAPVPNDAKGGDPVLVAPGDSEKLVLTAQVGEKDVGSVAIAVRLDGAALAAPAEALALAPVTLEIDPERTEDEN